MTSNETYAGEFYCVKCKEKREAEGRVVVSETAGAWPRPCARVRHEPQRILGKA